MGGRVRVRVGVRVRVRVRVSYRRDHAHVCLDFSVTDSRDALISHALIVQYDSQRSIQKVVFPERKLKQTTLWHQKRRDTEIDLADQNIPLPHGGLLSRS